MLGHWNWFRAEDGKRRKARNLDVRNENGHFDNPGAGPKQAWRVGEVQNITFDTIFESYNIALWQQNKNGGGASLGPVLFQLGTGQPKTTSFIWTVQTYKFDLDVSDNFFLWIYNGSDASTQGKKLPSVSSAYFTILEKAPDTTTTSASSTSSSTSSSTLASPTFDTGSATGTNLPADTHSTAASTNNDSTNTVPIAVGVSLGVVGVAVLLGLLFWFMRRRKMQQAGAVHEVDGQANNFGGHTSYNGYANVHNGSASYSGHPPVEAYTNTPEVKPAWIYQGSEVQNNRYHHNSDLCYGSYSDAQGRDRKVSELGTDRGPVELG